MPSERGEHIFVRAARRGPADRCQPDGAHVTGRTRTKGRRLHTRVAACAPCTPRPARADKIAACAQNRRVRTEMGACEARTKVESRRWKVEDRPSEIDHRTSTIGDRRIAGSGSLCAPSLCEEGLTLPQERKFRAVAGWEPAGDQPRAIQELSNALLNGARRLTLLGATGTGKTFTMAKVIERVQKPTLVIAHNKTLAAQLCSEFRSFFPENAVHYFISYYDYYQPEAYIPQTDTYIEKDTSINDEIDRLRHAATSALFERR